MQGVLAPAIELWSFKSPGGLSSPHFESVSFILTLSQVGLRQHLTSPRKFELIVAREIACMLTSSSSNGSNKGVARILDVDNHNIWKALGRWVQ